MFKSTPFQSTFPNQSQEDEGIDGQPIYHNEWHMQLHISNRSVNKWDFSLHTISNKKVFSCVHGCFLPLDEVKIVNRQSSKSKVTDPNTSPNSFPIVIGWTHVSIKICLGTTQKHSYPYEKQQTPFNHWQVAQPHKWNFVVHKPTLRQFWKP